MKTKKSQKIFKNSQTLLVGGVNSPVRAFGSVGGVPLVIKKGRGVQVYDEDGNGYIDFVNSWGALILGHGHPSVVGAIQKAAPLGTSFGAPTQAEYLLAKEIQKAFPSIQKIRLVNSGTEATQSAIRLARGFTQREKILKFSGCYHGHTDSLLVKAGSGGATFGIPTSQGIPGALAEKTRVIEFNNEEELRAI
ncbi:MAG: aminotransferase class III-fold pyridoxal phosphate-dependent enzyme, partial [Deltaproteobacteria bacterium]|nr:aminotransferase class III-fold pyridoxal phosphate-dependent enzyme [Deltaproteobacteria bacterium]